MNGTRGNQEVLLVRCVVLSCVMKGGGEGVAGDGIA